MTLSEGSEVLCEGLKVATSLVAQMLLHVAGPFFVISLLPKNKTTPLGVRLLFVNMQLLLFH